MRQLPFTLLCRPVPSACPLGPGLPAPQCSLTVLSFDISFPQSLSLYLVLKDLGGEKAGVGHSNNYLVQVVIKAPPSAT